jgi:hypothetical protein
VRAAADVRVALLVLAVVAGEARADELGLELRGGAQFSDAVAYSGELAHRFAPALGLALRFRSTSWYATTSLDASTNLRDTHVHLLAGAGVRAGSSQSGLVEVGLELGGHHISTGYVEQDNLRVWLPEIGLRLGLRAQGTWTFWMAARHDLDEDRQTHLEPVELGGTSFAAGLAVTGWWPL